MTLIEKIFAHPATQYLLRLYRNVNEDYIGLLAAGIAFYFFMAAFPALAALISLYGLVADPAFVPQQLGYLERFLPPESLDILSSQAQKIASSANSALSLGFVFGLILTVFSTMRGIQALIKGLNIAYNISERRNILQLGYTAFLLTLFMLIYLLFSLSLIALMPAFFNLLNLPTQITDPLLLLRWPLLLLSAAIGIEILYNHAPARPERKWRLVSPGAFVATLFWLGGSSLFSMFVVNFGNFNETYGSLGAVAVLLLWFWLNALSILFGAEVNAAFHSRSTD